MRSPKTLLRIAPAIPFFVLVTMFLLLPLAGMVVKSFLPAGGGAPTLQNYAALATKPIYLSALRNSLYLSLVSSMIGLALSFCVALAIVSLGGRTRGAMSAMLNMVSNFAGLPLAIAFIVVLGTSGVVTLLAARLGLDFLASFDLYSVNGLLLLFVYFQIPLGTLMLLPAFEGVRPTWRESAALMRAGPVRFWLSIGIPVMLSSIFDTFAMLFANALTAYATPFMLMTTNLPLLPIKVASMFTGEMTSQQEMGSALSIEMMALMLAVIGLCNLGKRLFCKGGTE